MLILITHHSHTSLSSHDDSASDLKNLSLFLCAMMTAKKKTALLGQKLWTDFEKWSFILKK